MSWSDWLALVTLPVSLLSLIVSLKSARTVQEALEEVIRNGEA